MFKKRGIGAHLFGTCTCILIDDTKLICTCQKIIVRIELTRIQVYIFKFSLILYSILLLCIQVYMYLCLCSYTISVIRWNGTLTLNQHRVVASHPYWWTLLSLLSKNLQYIYKIGSYRCLQIIPKRFTLGPF